MDGVKVNQHNWKDCTDVPYEQRVSEGTLGNNFLDVTGERFGLLTAVKPLMASGGKDGKRLRWKWVFRCDCGNYVERFISNVKMSVQKGCVPACPACARSRQKRRQFKHGQTGSQLYRVWRNMRNRCQNPDAQAYPRYGGRGIKVCERWQEFNNFVADMGSTFHDDLVLDRIDNNGDYCPENCRWTTYRVNCRNRSGTYSDLDLEELSHITGISKTTLHYRVTRGWPLELLAMQPSVMNARLQAYLVNAKYKREYMTSSTADQDIVSLSEESEDQS